MAGTSRTALRKRAGRSLPDVLPPVLAAVTLLLIAAQFALAGFGAFTADKTPAGDPYAAHMVLGVVVGVTAWLLVAAVLASPAARAATMTLWLAVTAAVLALPVEPLLGETGQHVPALGALHALNGLAMAALTGVVTRRTAHRETR
jgi:hypothetical protein